MFPNALTTTDMFGNDNPYRNSMRQMDQMMNSFFGGFPDPMAGMMMPFGGGMFGNFGSMMGMNNPMNMMVGGNHPGQSFSSSSSTFMSYSSNGPNGQPQVYKASTSTRTGPGGVKETKKAVSDSRTGVKKLAIGHHIGDRAHIVERQQNVYSGDQEENQEYINLDDDEAEEFNNEWRKKAQNMNSHRSRYLPYTHRVQNSSVPLKRNLKAIAPPPSTARISEVLAVEGHQDQGRKRAAKQRTPKKIEQYPVNDA
ncbi:myeloid leukemia factor isoform X1 [Acyrthosiphon pisum]|uniref:Myeloid leukemia factor n=1 Tax=Acyrthosiphon pisum TaxID=7029 RepID=A0A8R1WYY7_ACYPI|nr:myeloid leukemia factor isoform X1 [Acyrthosiphon pisum]XP_008179970.1 myeloid leukemia factor isoform X1 [Acyrthosiphon pisum]|eukprot:XP_001952446.1 PREDICTED: myeloid leukemia factor isoform X1 [Acyrthosiphon pisum]